MPDEQVARGVGVRDDSIDDDLTGYDANLNVMGARRQAVGDGNSLIPLNIMAL